MLRGLIKILSPKPAFPGRDHVSWEDFPLNETSEQKDKVIVITQAGRKATPKDRALAFGYWGEGGGHGRSPCGSSPVSSLLDLPFIHLFLLSPVGVEVFLKTRAVNSI